VTEHLAPLAGTCIVVVVTPGPDNALAVPIARCGGRPGSVGMALGVVCG
jgi:threonine/homoserine/homoserine lactone efflux protein